MSPFKRLIVPAALAAAFLMLAPGPATAQVRLNGYFAAEYLQGRSQSPWSVGTFGGVQAGLIISGEWSQQFGYTLELRARGIDQPQVEQAWASWIWSQAFQAKLGVYLVPFGRYNVAERPFQTLLIDAPYGVAETRPRSWRDIGAMAEGDLGFVRYAAFIGNGLAEASSPADGQQWRDNNKNKGWGGRLSFPISQELDLGVSYYTGKQDAAGDRRLRLLGADAGWTTANILCQAEYTRADIDNPSGFAAGRVEGWFVLLGLTFGSFRPAASYQTSKADDPFHGAGWTDPLLAGEGSSWDHSRWTLGLSYALHPNVQIKVEYDWQKEKGPALDDNVLRVQAAIHF
jgi:hypothetical protein